MKFRAAPLAVPDSNLFGGLMEAFADSLPDGWGVLLMERFFMRGFGIDRRALSALDRLEYIGNRSMGALEDRP